MNDFYWLKDSKKKKYPSLNQEVTTDILIIGGGICGLSIAYELSHLNNQIILVDQNEFYHATSGYTTGKITFQHGYIYQELLKTKSQEIAKLYYQGNNQALKHLKDIILKEKIECEFKNCNHSLLSKEKNTSFILEEKAYKTLNIPYEKQKIKDYDALTIANQGIFHIVKYLDGILNYLDQCKNVSLYENSKVLKTDIKKKVATGANFIIHYKQVIFASAYPPYKNFNFYFLKLKPVMSFIGTGKIKESLKEAAIDENDPVFSFRPLKENEMMFAGFSQDTSALKSYQKSENLIAKVKDSFHIEDIQINYNQDYQTLDKIPYIGAIKKDTYFATGFNKWGISNSILASLILKDLIVQKKSVYEKVFSPKRNISMLKYVAYSFKNISTFISSKIHHHSYKCSHLHCNLKKNPLSETWDCPCHGSRFDENGKVINGPAKKDFK